MVCLLLLTVNFSTLAHQNKVFGKVIGQDGLPAIDVVITMYDIDSTYLAATLSTEDGFFELPLHLMPITLQFDHLMYKRKRDSFNNPDIGEVVLEPISLELDEIVVEAYRPIVKVEEGKLIYDIKQMATGTTATNVYEAISKLPGVDEKDNRLQLAGAGNLTVIINGKPTSMNPTQLKAILSSMPIERVKHADVMYSAPPQYNVRGGVINLVLEQTKDHSHSGEVRGNYINQHKDTWGTGVSMAMSTPKWSAETIYSFENSFTPQQLSIYSQHLVDHETTSIEQIQKTKSRGDLHHIRATFDYTLSEKEFIHVVYNGRITPSTRSFAKSKGSFIDSRTNKSGSNALHNIAIGYKTKSGFNIGADYSSYRNRGNSLVSNLSKQDKLNTFHVNAGQNISRLNFYVDKEHRLNPKWNLTYGMKGIWANDKDFQNYSNMEENREMPNTNTRLTEWTANLYVGARKKLSQGSIAVSLTGEYYNLEGKQNYSFYPQANFMWMFDKNNIIQFNISTDKTYPAYWSIQNAISYIDGYSEIHGNSSLKPMRKYSSQAVYIHKQRYIFAVFLNHTANFFSQTAYQAPDRLALIYKHINFNYARQYGINIMIPFSVGRIIKSKASLVGMRIEQRCDNFYDLSFKRTKWVGVATLNNTLAISKKPAISLEVVARYQSPAIQGLYDLDKSWSIDTGLKISLLKKKLDITAKYNDIFKSQLPPIDQNYKTQNLNMKTGACNRTFTIHVSYRFGGFTKKARKEVDSSRFGH